MDRPDPVYGGRLRGQKVFKKLQEGKGRLRKRWLDGLEISLRSLRVRRWQRVVEEREEWKQTVLEAGALHGL